MTTPTFLSTLADLGYSPSQAAEAAGVTVDQVRKILRGQRTASASATLAIVRHAELVRLGAEARVPERVPGRPRAA